MDSETLAQAGCSRDHPSARYRELLALYRQMHREGEQFLRIVAAETFPGFSLFPQAGRIKQLIGATRSRTILDYGSGKGQQYAPRVVQDEHGQVWGSVAAYWDEATITCYDPCYAPFAALPDRMFDGVICTDVLEHCPEPDLPWILQELFGFAQRFVFANIACYPAKKRLPNGENAHCTIKPVEWWHGQVIRAAQRHPRLRWEFWLQYPKSEAGTTRLVELRLGD